MNKLCVQEKGEEQSGKKFKEIHAEALTCSDVA